MWLQEVKTYKCATQDINGLKEVPGPQLALDLPEGSESELEIFDTFDTKEMKGENGWNAVIDLLKLHYKTGNSREAFKHGKSLKHGQPVDEYTIYYENYKTKMQQFDMTLGEQTHGLNILCGAHFSNDKLRIAMKGEYSKRI